MNRITRLFNVKYPVVQGGMIWASGWRLASAVSNAGGLGLIGSGSMYPDVLREHIQKCKSATDKPYGVNIPMLYPDLDQVIEIILEEKVPIVFTSAGNPKTYTELFKKENRTVVHVVSSSKFAIKAEDAGVDAVVAEGFEAGGHNGREETTTLVLVPGITEKVSVPVLAAGGIATGAAMFAVMALGAEGVQIGSRFVASEEASSHPSFKKMVMEADEGHTHLTLKELAPVRLLKNKFYEDVIKLYSKSPSSDDLRTLLGRARAKRGMFEGDLEEGELEIGQVSGLIHDILPASEIIQNIMTDFKKTGERMKSKLF